MNGVDGLKLERTARWARRLLMPRGGAQEAGGELGVGYESASPGSGLGQADISAIASRLASARTSKGETVSRTEAEGLARSLVADARRGLEKLEGAAEGVLGQPEAVALEAVLLTRGRPAVKVMGAELEDINAYPESGMWAQLVDDHRANVMAVTMATAAVRVTDTLLTDRQWVQGTAFLIGDGLAMTNRHVLFPPGQGTRLARRLPGTTNARMKGEYEVLLDFAFDSGARRDLTYRITGVPFVAEDADPIDAAVLQVEPVAGAAKPLTVSKNSIFDIDRLFIVGHPGRVGNVPDDIFAVFGEPDERKRVSFGTLMDMVEPGQIHVVHDASTIGGYSGAGVLGFATAQVRALHYWGDSVSGNRAIASDALRAHKVLGPMIP
ncbi:hypothetical protein MesoLjLc_46060 [Mesorhizobium sp. L-8-10]|uniref:trypsin-like serine peptidase n=1 Tax=unclassified Mesorhizobium TaxID=325217 RepID=UPI001925B64D|nr:MULTISPECIES: serine protease [unclassified Mesorhizobium]BCH24887.1 hypothetical protein MesoLjLb_46720 [Mesorhizobium sp. L-8-3]BCH32676.1 hypothetical protein MesoLjLc_46060 [Mesorhizobium sp. L-8-10]